MPYGTVLNYPSDSKVENPGDILAKWDPLTRPVVAEVASEKQNLLILKMALLQVYKQKMNSLG